MKTSDKLINLFEATAQQVDHLRESTPPLKEIGFGALMAGMIVLAETNAAFLPDKIISAINLINELSPIGEESCFVGGVVLMLDGFLRLFNVYPLLGAVTKKLVKNLIQEKDTS